jgi:hypothetical protein
MSITKTIEIFKKLLKETNNRKEIKLYKGFIAILSNLKSRNLTENPSQLIQEKLSSLNLKATTENRKKYYKQKLSEFKEFLKNEFSFTSEKYYTEMGMVYGMIFGSGVGLALGTALGTTIGGGTGTAIGTAIGSSTGASIGMVFGMIFGARKDAEAKRQGRVI